MAWKPSSKVTWVNMSTHITNIHSFWMSHSTFTALSPYICPLVIFSCPYKIPTFWQSEKYIIFFLPRPFPSLCHYIFPGGEVLFSNYIEKPIFHTHCMKSILCSFFKNPFLVKSYGFSLLVEVIYQVAHNDIHFKAMIWINSDCTEPPLM